MIVLLDCTEFDFAWRVLANKPLSYNSPRRNNLHLSQTLPHELVSFRFGHINNYILDDGMFDLEIPYPAIVHVSVRKIY